MTARLDGKNVRARFPDCGGAITTFEHKRDHTNDHGSIRVEEKGAIDGSPYDYVVFQLLRCAGCGRAGMSKIAPTNPMSLIDFYPRSIDQPDVPTVVPDDIKREFREAEQCASIKAWRGAAALLRSTLEKTLEATRGHFSGFGVCFGLVGLLMQLAAVLSGSAAGCGHCDDYILIAAMSG